MFENFWLTLLSNAVYCFSLMSGQFIYTPKADARKNFLYRLLGCIAVNTVIIVLMTLTDSWQLATFKKVPILSSGVLSATATISLWVCYKSKHKRLIYSAIAGFMLMQIYMQPAKIVQSFTQLIGVNPIITAVKIASWLAIYTIEYFWYIRHLADDTHYEPDIGQVVMLGIFAFIVLNSTLLESIVFASNKVAYVILCLGETLLCFVVLFNQYLGYKAFEKDKQKAVEMELERDGYKQFERYSQIVDILNIKCHDLKHQIRELGGKNSLSPEVISELNKTAEIYDSFVKTGNPHIDTVLTEKSLRCEAAGIQMTWMLDGEGLSYMTPYDINALFGNALDNAIQCEEKQDKENRYIAISCKVMQSFIHIHITNYIAELPVMGKDGLPVTSNDENYHGFGMKSMRRIAEKYGGSLQVSAKNNTFSLDLMMPYSKDSQ